jgi:hypothetical protein
LVCELRQSTHHIQRGGTASSAAPTNFQRQSLNKRHFRRQKAQWAINGDSISTLDQTHGPN